MRHFKRGAVAAAIATALAALAPAAASAAITPNPYSTTSGSGSFTIMTTLGTGRCNLSGVSGGLTSATGGASGSFTGLTVSGCAGVITAGQYSEPISFAVDRGAVTVGFGVQLTNIYGGRCVYRGALTGTAAERATSFTVAGTLTLTRTLSGICDPTYSTSATLSLPGQSITWTTPPSSGLSPDPYSTAAGTGILSLQTYYGSAGCQLGAVEIDATGVSAGARGTISGFTASNCYGVLTRAQFDQNVTFSAASGAVSVALNALVTNVFGGTCLYSGTLTGTVPNGGYVLSARGDLTLTRALGGYCETPQSAAVGIALPGARISW